MEVNLQVQLSVYLHFRKLKMLLKFQVFNLISHFCARSISEILKFQIWYLKKVGQGHYV